MSDSEPPPVWGHEPLEERDLEELLRGDAAGVVAVLCAEPALAELAGEADARALFRQLRPFGGFGPAEGLAGTGRSARHRKPVSRLRCLQGAVLAGGLAAALAVTIAITARGPGQTPARPGSPLPATQPQTAPGGTTAPRLEGGASTVPSPSLVPTAGPSTIPSSRTTPSGSASASASAALCRQYLESLIAPGSASARQTGQAALATLKSLAGTQVVAHCLSALSGQPEPSWVRQAIPWLGQPGLAVPVPAGAVPIGSVSIGGGPTGAGGLGGPDEPANGFGIATSAPGDGIPGAAGGARGVSVAGVGGAAAGVGGVGGAGGGAGAGANGHAAAAPASGANAQH